MIYDVRTYTCRPGTVPLQFKLYQEHGMGPQNRHLGQPVVYGHVEVGTINTFTHIWAYDSQADREQKRAAMMADPDWLVYIKKSGEAGYMVAQENKILVAAPWMTK
jgi:hypothetical protein